MWRVVGSCYDKSLAAATCREMAWNRFQHIRQIQCTTPCPTNRSLAWAPISLHDATSLLPAMTLWRGLAQKLAHRCAASPAYKTSIWMKKLQRPPTNRLTQQIPPLAHAMPTCLDKCFDSFEEHLAPSKPNKTRIFLEQTHWSPALAYPTTWLEKSHHFLLAWCCPAVCCRAFVD